MEYTSSKFPNLKIITDDLGLHQSVNEGIIYLLRGGYISGASLMANGEAFNDAVRQCLEIQLPNIGVHLVLVEEKSLLNEEQIPTLLNNKGSFYKNHLIFFIRYVLGLIKKDEIRKEIEAQIQKIFGAGIKPKFINSHQHLHLLPGIMDIVIALAKEYGIDYIRIVNESFGIKGSLFRKGQLLFLRLLSGFAKREIIKNHLKFNDFFVGFINAGNLGVGDIDTAVKLASRHPNKMIELGCHPGFENESIGVKYKHWGDYNWQKELKVLQESIKI